VIDAGNSFTPGQVYVALSRCTSLEGLTLLSKIQPHVIQTNYEIQRFANNEDDVNKLESQLAREKKNFSHLQALRLFDWNPLIKDLYKFKEDIGKKVLIEKKEFMELANALIKRALEQKEVAEKFNEQLKKLLLDIEDENSSSLAVERLTKACIWFAHKLFDELIYPLNNMHDRIGSLPKKAKLLMILNESLDACWQKVNQIQNASFLDFGFSGMDKIYTREPSIEKKAIEKNPPKSKKVKGESNRETLRLLNNGLSVNDIAIERKLAPSTVQGHLASLIEEGSLHVSKILDAKKIAEIESLLLEEPEKSISSFLEEHPGSFAYYEFKQVLSQLLFDKKIK
jgi:hypothetical protein